MLGSTRDRQDVNRRGSPERRTRCFKRGEGRNGGGRISCSNGGRGSRVQVQGALAEADGLTGIRGPRVVFERDTSAPRTDSTHRYNRDGRRLPLPSTSTTLSAAATTRSSPDGAALEVDLPAARIGMGIGSGEPPAQPELASWSGGGRGCSTSSPEKAWVASASSAPGPPDELRRERSYQPRRAPGGLALVSSWSSSASTIAYRGRPGYRRARRARPPVAPRRLLAATGFRPDAGECTWVEYADGYQRSPQAALGLTRRPPARPGRGRRRASARRSARSGSR